MVPNQLKNKKYFEICKYFDLYLAAACKKASELINRIQQTEGMNAQRAYYYIFKYTFFLFCFSR